MKVLMKSRLVAIFLVALIIAGCGNQSKTQQETNNSKKIIFEDSLGRKFEFDKEITKIAPSGTMAQVVLAGLAPEKMVVIAKKPSEKTLKKLAKFPTDKPEVGQFYGKEPNFNKEEVIKANPEIIIDIGEKKKTIEEDIKTIEDNTGVKVVFIELTPKTAAKAYEMLGKLLNKENEAKKAAEFLSREVATIEEGLNKIPQDKRVSFIQVGGKDALSVDLINSIHAEAIEFAGGVNKADTKSEDKKSKTEGINMEEVIKWNPDFIFAKDEKTTKTIMDSDSWKNLNAVKNGKVITIPIDAYSFVASPPSVNKMLGIYWAAQIMYPEEFKYNFDEIKREFDSVILGVN